MDKRCREGDVVRSGRFACGRQAKDSGPVRLGVAGGYIGRNIKLPPHQRYLVVATADTVTRHDSLGRPTVDPDSEIYLKPLVQEDGEWRLDESDGRSYFFSHSSRCPNAITPSEVELVGHLPTQEELPHTD